MARRNNKSRIPTDAVQGEGSYVVLRRMTVDELTGLGKAMEGANTEEQIAYSRAIVSQYVEEWDWVDDEGQPLPFPKDDPSVVGKLTDLELKTIIEGFNPENDKKK